MCNIYETKVLMAFVFIIFLLFKFLKNNLSEIKEKYVECVLLRTL